MSDPQLGFSVLTGNTYIVHGKKKTDVTAQFKQVVDQAVTKAVDEAIAAERARVQKAIEEVREHWDELIGSEPTLIALKYELEKTK